VLPLELDDPGKTCGSGGAKHEARDPPIDRPAILGACVFEQELERDSSGP
jgi:hypothetical protein